MLWAHALELHAGEQTVCFLLFVGFVTNIAEVVSIAVADPADKALEVEIVLFEVGGHAIQKLWKRGHVLVVEIVDRIGESTAEEHTPHTVGDGAWEAVVLHKESGKLFTTALAFSGLHLGAIDKGSLSRQYHAVTFLVVNKAFFVGSLIFAEGERWVGHHAGPFHRGHASAFHLAEERIHTPEMLLGDRVVERVIVALGALELHAEEKASDTRGDRHHLEHAFFSALGCWVVFTQVRQNEVYCGVVGVLAVGRYQLRYQLVVGHILGELVFEPHVQVGVVFATSKNTRAAQEPVGPHGSPVVGILFVGQKVFNDLRPAAGLRIVHVLANFFGLRDTANDVERDAADKFVIVDEARRLNLVFGPSGAQFFVDKLNGIRRDLHFVGLADKSLMTGGNANGHAGLGFVVAITLFFFLVFFFGSFRILSLSGRILGFFFGVLGTDQTKARGHQGHEARQSYRRCHPTDPPTC